MGLVGGSGIVILEIQLLSFIEQLFAWCGGSSSSMHWQSGDSTLLMSHRNLFRLMWSFRRLGTPRLLWRLEPNL